MRFKVEEFVVNENLLPALINDDYTALTDDDDAAVTAFKQRVYDEHGLGHWDSDPADTSRFAFCECLESFGTCHTVKYLYRGKK